MYLTLGVTSLDSTIDIELVLYSQCTVGAPVWRSKASMYHQISLALLAALYTNLIIQRLHMIESVLYSRLKHQEEYE